MTTRIALVLAALATAAATVDALANDGAGLAFLVRKLFDLVEYLSFWR